MFRKNTHMALITILFGIGLVALSTVWAQNNLTEYRIRGICYYGQTPVNGATIYLKGPGAKTHIHNWDYECISGISGTHSGSFSFSGLEPGVYEIWAEYTVCGGSVKAKSPRYQVLVGTGPVDTRQNIHIGQVSCD